MLKNYLSVAIRNVLRNKLFSTLNILGLAFGMASALLIFLWINDELSVDQYHDKISRIYRVIENQQYTDGRLFTFSSTPGPMAPFIKEKYPEIELASRFTWPVNELFQFGEKSFFEEGRYVDQDFLNIFTFKQVAGDLSKALSDKSSMVVTRSFAEKFFGKEDPLGKVLVMNTKHSFAVTAVIEDLPNRSSIQFTYLLPFQFFFDENKSWLDQWGNNNIRTFITLKENTDVEGFSRKFRDEIKSHVEKSNVELLVQPFADYYLHGNFENGKQAGGRIDYVKIFFVVAIFVLVIACINFTNLATAQATRRAKEVGLRKVIGAFPRQLFYQFMGESFLTVLFGAVIAVGLVLIALPAFNELTKKELGLFLLDGRVAIIVGGILLFTALTAGSYPAFVISEYRPVEVLKGQLKSGSRATFFRKTLVVVQFSLSIVLIISTLVVFRQMKFMENRDIGFKRDNLFYMWMQGDMNEKLATVRTRLLSLPGIEGVTASSQLPIDIGNSTHGVSWEGKNPEDRILFTNMDVDDDFVQTMRMEMAEGRPFDQASIGDTSNYLVNEVAAAKFNFKGETAGQDLTMWDRKGKIIGVVKNFNFGSLHSPIEPLILRMPRRYHLGNLNCLIIRAKENQTQEALRSAEKVWKEYAAVYPFKYSFLNQDWENFYAAEDQRGKVFNVLSGLSILISCLGLFGLSAFSAQRRTKELGIRKVMGASVPGLMGLLSREFAVLVLIAALIGCPAGWYFMNDWLSKYAFHVDVGWLTLVMAAMSCLAVSLLTVSYHSLRVTMVNPAISLRYE